MSEASVNDKSRRPWFRFSLRTLFVVVTVAGTTSGRSMGSADLRQQANSLVRRPMFGSNLLQFDSAFGFHTREIYGPGKRRKFSIPDEVEKGMIYDRLEFRRRLPHFRK